MDGTGSHTHGAGLVLEQYIWSEGENLLATGSLTPTLNLTVGSHTITLKVIDDGANEGVDYVEIEVLAYGYPAVLSVTPDSGSISGGELVTITGSGFSYTAEETIVHFGEGAGRVSLSGDDIIVKDFETIEVMTPSTVVGIPVAVSVETPLAESNNDVSYTYIAGVPLDFETDVLTPLDGPTTVSLTLCRSSSVGTISILTSSFLIIIPLGQVRARSQPLRWYYQGSCRKNYLQRRWLHRSAGHGSLYGI